MAILFLSVAIVSFVVFLRLLVKYPEERSVTPGKHELFFFLTILSASFIFIIGTEVCILSFSVATESTIDRKIEMYQEENAKIEQSISKIVNEYMAHEHDTFADLKTEESSITLVTLFPELKSNALVQQQLEIYVENNAEIKKLKEEKINISKMKWLLYFGM